MEKKPNSTSPATVRLSTTDAINALIDLVDLEIDTSLQGKLNPSQICNAAETLLMGLIKGLHDKLMQDENFRNHFVCLFVTETDLYLLTDPTSLDAEIENKQKEKLRIVLPVPPKTH